MGVYAQTDITIECQDKKIAKEVVKKIKKESKKNENDLNWEYDNLDADEKYVYLSKSSGRIQNLEYQCEQLWKAIKNINGVIEMNCPFLAEANGKYFNNEN